MTMKTQPDLSRRQWFAGMALQGILASEPVNINGVDAQNVAALAYIYADAMLAYKAPNTGGSGSASYT